MCNYLPAAIYDSMHGGNQTKNVFTFVKSQVVASTFFPTVYIDHMLIRYREDSAIKWKSQVEAVKISTITDRLMSV